MSSPADGMAQRPLPPLPPPVPSSPRPGTLDRGASLAASLSPTATSPYAPPVPTSPRPNQRTFSSASGLGSRSQPPPVPTSRRPSGAASLPPGASLQPFPSQPPPVPQSARPSVSARSGTLPAAPPTGAAVPGLPPFFHGAIGTKMGQIRLEGLPFGSFLIRLSSDRTGFTMQRVRADGRGSEALRITGGFQGGGFHVMPQSQGYPTPWALEGKDPKYARGVPRTGPLSDADAREALAIVARQPRPVKPPVFYTDSGPNQPAPPAPPPAAADPGSPPPVGSLTTGLDLGLPVVAEDDDDDDGPIYDNSGSDIDFDSDGGGGGGDDGYEQTSPVADGDGDFGGVGMAAPAPAGGVAFLDGPLPSVCEAVPGSGEQLPEELRASADGFREALPALQSSALGAFLASRFEADVGLLETQLGLVRDGWVIGVHFEAVAALYAFLVEDQRTVQPGPGFVTEVLVSQLVRPFSASLGVPLLPVFFGLRSETGPLVNVASTFVSHAWAAPYEGLVRSIDLDRREHQAEAHYWIDVLCRVQHHQTVAAPPPLDEVEATLAATSKTLLCLGSIAASPSLARLWCLYEAHRTLALRHRLALQIPEGIHTVPGADAVAQLTRQVSVKAAKATQKADSKLILKRIKAGGSKKAVDMDLKAALKVVVMDAQGSSA